MKKIKDKNIILAKYNIMIQNIPSQHIVTMAARHNKDYEIEFVNTELAKDMYTIKCFLRFIDKNYRIRVLLTSNILSYPALDVTWRFEESKFDHAARVFHRICDELDYIKTHTDENSVPLSVLSATVREALKPIAVSFRESVHNLNIDEAVHNPGEGDWRTSLYGDRYPSKSKEKGSLIKD